MSTQRERDRAEAIAWHETEAEMFDLTAAQYSPTSRIGRAAQENSAMHRRFAAALRLQGEHGWRPIESAPKDESEILVWGPGPYSGYMTAVAWWWQSDTDNKPHWYTFSNYPLQFKPSHWMPLPASPVPQEKPKVHNPFTT